MNPPQPTIAPREIFDSMLEYGVMPTFDIVFQYGDQGLIVLKRKIPPYKDVWALPGLRMLKGESIEDTITRIAQQELGLSIDPRQRMFLDQYVGMFTTEHQRQDLSTGFLIKLNGNEKLQPNPEHFSQLQIVREIPPKTGAMYAHYLKKALPYVLPDLPPARTTGTILFETAEKMGLSPQQLTDYGVFSVNHKGTTHRFFHNILPFNNLISGYTATDKYTARLILQEMGEKNIPFCLPQSLQEAEAFLQEQGTIILKPTAGSRARDTWKISSLDQLKKHNWLRSILERFIEGTEVRVLMLDGEVLGVAEKTLAPSSDEPWKKRWRTHEASEVSAELKSRSLAIAEAFKLRWCAVDYIRDADGTHWVLEVNVSPGFVHFHEPDEGPVIDIASQVLATIVSE